MPAPIDYAAAGRKLRAARETLKIKQVDVAEQLGKTDALVSRIEGGAKTPIENLAIYAQMVGGDVAAVVAGPNDRAGRLAARMARVVPLLDEHAEEQLISTLEAWTLSWERKYLAGRESNRGG